ncbi:MAG: hypothetical protein Rubg2KO_04340 [Rubricoccaceae bacterium]
MALVLEGTYPYAIGGVSTWVDGLIRTLPTVTFGVVHLYAGQPPVRSHFVRPENVNWQLDLALPDQLAAVDPKALAARVPPARCVHALATGFAGQVAMAVKSRTGAPLLLTEHGIYWYEIQEGAPELECGLRLHGQDLSDGNPCANRALWVDRFQDIARETYAAADVITTVCEANVPLQRQLGAETPLVIPNGVDVPDAVLPLTDAELETLHASARQPAGLRIGLVGRVTPIKDVHAFVRVAARVAERVPEAHFYVVGPTDDIEYAARVRTLARRLGLADRFHLTGAQPAALWHRHLDIVVLTSRSEAQPLALLEAMAHGRPVVAPDVGGCRDLVAGDGRAPCGLIVPRPSDDLGLGDVAPGIADALLELAMDEDLRKRLGANGRQRAEGWSVEEVARRYKEHYDELIPGAFASSRAA